MKKKNIHSFDEMGVQAGAEEFIQFCLFLSCEAETERTWKENENCSFKTEVDDIACNAWRPKCTKLPEIWHLVKQLSSHDFWTSWTNSTSHLGHHLVIKRFQSRTEIFPFLCEAVMLLSFWKPHPKKGASLMWFDNKEKGVLPAQ